MVQRPFPFPSKLRAGLQAFFSAAAVLLASAASAQVEPQLTAITRTSSATLTTGGTLSFNFTVAPGSTNPIQAIEIFIQNSSGNKYTVASPTGENSGAASIATTSWPIGSYTVTSILVVANSTEQTTYNPGGTISYSNGGTGPGTYSNFTLASLDFSLASNPSGVAPTISGQPGNQTVNVGGAAFFSVTATGTPTPAYQWLFDNTAIAGATSSTYSINSAQSSNAGSYEVVVSNSAGSVTSNPANLAVNPPSGAPLIVSQPQSQTVATGAPASFSVTASGSGTLSYQWSFGGSPIAGATSPSYGIGSAQLSNTGSYTVTVSNSLGSATSNAVTLALSAPPGAPIITSQPQSQTVAAGAPASLSVAASGTGNLSYQWSFNGSPLSGANGPTYAIANSQAANGGTYTVAVSNATGSVNSAGAVLTVTPTGAVALPSLLAQPQSQQVLAGGSVSFSVTASSTAPLAYQWSYNGIALGGATAATYTINAVQTANAGNYTVVVTDSAGSVTSNAATLTVDVLPAITAQPGNQTVLQGSTAQFSVSATGVQPFTYQWYFNGSAISGATAITYSLSNAQPANAGSYSVTVANANGSVTSNGALLAVQSAGSPTLSSQPQSQTVAAGSTVVLTASTSGTAPASYQWELNGVAIPGATSSTLLVSGAGSTNAGTYAVLASNASGSVLSNSSVLTVMATTNPGRLVNLSVNTTAGQSQVLTVGFVTGGAGTSGAQALLIRATGPALAAFGVPNTLADPTLSVLSGSTVVASNDNWGTPASNQTVVTAADNATGAFALTNPASLDAALVDALTAGGYTVQISGNTAATGTTLAEVYDNTPANTYTSTTPRLINISANNQIAANGSLTAGFVIGGSTAKTVLIRATGPALALLGVGNTMPDPQLALHTTVNSQDTVLATDAGWGGDPQLTSVSNSVGAFPLTNPSSKDSVLLTTLAPGAYTAVASSVSGTAGVALVEVYEVP